MYSFKAYLESIGDVKCSISENDYFLEFHDEKNNIKILLRSWEGDPEFKTPIEIDIDIVVPGFEFISYMMESTVDANVTLNAFKHLYQNAQVMAKILMSQNRTHGSSSSHKEWESINKLHFN